MTRAVAAVLAITLGLWFQAPARGAWAADVGPARGEEGLAPVLPDLLREAMRRNPSVESARLRWEAAKERIPQARSLDDPMVGYTVMGSHLETRLGPQDQKFMVSQRVPLFGKLSWRGERAEAMAEAEAARYRGILLNVERDVVEHYYALAWAQEAQRVVREQVRIVEEVSAAARARYAALEGGYEDVVRAHLELAELEDRLERLREEEHRAAADLNRLLDRPAQTSWPDLAFEESLPPPPRPAEELFDLAERFEPDLARARAEATQAQAEVELARRGLLPDVTLGFEYVAIGNGATTQAEDGRDAWMFPLTFNLPVWERPRALLREAKAHGQAAERGLAAMRNDVRARIRQSRAEWVSAQERLRIAREAAIPEATGALESHLAGYRAGTMPLAMALESQRRLLELELEERELLARLHTVQGGLRRITGTDPSEGNGS